MWYYSLTTTYEFTLLFYWFMKNINFCSHNINTLLNTPLAVDNEWHVCDETATTAYAAKKKDKRPTRTGLRYFLYQIKIK